MNSTTNMPPGTKVGDESPKEILCLGCGKLTDGSERCDPCQLDLELRQMRVRLDFALVEVSKLKEVIEMQQFCLERNRLAFGEIAERHRILRIATRTENDQIDDISNTVLKAKAAMAGK